jgi:mRNA interferase HigB
MRVISRGPIVDFGAKHPPAVIPLNDWYSKILQATCSNFSELKEVYRTCDYIGDDRYVFNIGGNNYRLVAIIKFKNKCLYVRGVLTHTEYDAHNKNGTLITM